MPTTPTEVIHNQKGRTKPNRYYKALLLLLVLIVISAGVMLLAQKGSKNTFPYSGTYIVEDSQNTLTIYGDNARFHELTSVRDKVIEFNVIRPESGGTVILKIRNEQVNYEEYFLTVMKKLNPGKDFYILSGGIYRFKTMPDGSILLWLGNSLRKKRTIRLIPTHNQK